MPLDRAASLVFHLCGDRPLDLIALGPGDGRLDTRFASCLLSHLHRAPLRLYLLDISQPLLAEAYRHAMDSLPAERTLIVAIQGNFHRLPQYSQLVYSAPSSPRRQLLLLLGGTFANLDHEHLFLRDSLCAFPSGTLLLLDFPCLFAPPDQPDLIRSADPWLSPSPATLSWRDRVTSFWSGPLRRYVPGCLSIDFSLALGSSLSTIPGGYTIEARALVHVDSGPPRDFSVFRLKRHDPLALVRSFKDLGWDGIDGWPYGHEVGYPRALYLFQKR